MGCGLVYAFEDVAAASGIRQRSPKAGSDEAERVSTNIPYQAAPKRQDHAAAVSVS